MTPEVLPEDGMLESQSEVPKAQRVHFWTELGQAAGDRIATTLQFDATVIPYHRFLPVHIPN